jgi:hypothetical protein
MKLASPLDEQLTKEDVMVFDYTKLMGGLKLAQSLFQNLLFDVGNSALGPNTACLPGPAPPQ